MRFAPFVALLLAAPLNLSAQEFRVYTTVSDVSGDRPIELSRSLTLFHAGQAWDHVVEAGEVVRFDPADAEFVILDTRRDLACTVKLEEVSRIINVGRKETEKYVAELRESPAPDSAALTTSLAFQLTPRYAIDADEGSRRTRFVGGPLTYEVSHAQPGRPSISAAYWDYADWTGQLNYALDPGKLFPDVRRPVHEALRERGVVPQRVEVLLTDAGGVPTKRLAAEHSFQEQLGQRDRELISRWRERLASPKTRRVTFAKYQQLTLGGVPQAAR
ncbi:hypothetical protein [Alienimonas californiensis]|uniref:DUF3857 domain-containing protein n=1 Tax=Alienimonas californiensis TaxID=2527989 RepID=A0A517P3V3_9PLAN|nr:hypothetical protein [Alienimonas californiensis]QDT14059.1 hypothetical protein CA12_01270 [Alienimonas californiensis]